MSREFNQCITKLTKEMVESYHEDDAYSSHISTVLPNRNEIIKLLNDLKELFYPRHFGGRELYNCTIQYYIGNLMMSVEERLHKQIRLALMRKYEQSEVHTPQSVADKAAKMSCAFMQTLPKIREHMTMDVQAAYDGDPAAADKDQIIFSYPGVFAMMVFRVAHELRILDVPLIPRVMTEYAHSRTGIDINPGATIGKYFFMDHGTGIVIGETTIIGDYVKLYQGVTLGALSTRGGQNLSGKKRHPTIEDRVTIYSNVSILGGETVIGHDAIIGGNAFITQSVPAGSKVSVKNPELQVEGGEAYEVSEDFEW
ncbi:MAG: serine O-acetyltransferase [Eubacterium sp.]